MHFTMHFNEEKGYYEGERVKISNLRREFLPDGSWCLHISEYEEERFCVPVATANLLIEMKKDKDAIEKVISKLITGKEFYELNEAAISDYQIPGTLSQALEPIGFYPLFIMAEDWRKHLGDAEHIKYVKLGEHFFEYPFICFADEHAVACVEKNNGLCYIDNGNLIQGVPKTESILAIMYIFDSADQRICIKNK